MKDLNQELRQRALRGLPALLSVLALVFLLLQALAYAGRP